MAFHEALADRVRTQLADQPAVRETRMFGGLSFMVRGHMCCGVTAADLMVRVGPDAYEDALREPDARPMDFTGRPLRGFVFVSAEALGSTKRLASWVRRGLAFVATLKEK